MHDTLLDLICKLGASNGLVSDIAKVKIWKPIQCINFRTLLSVSNNIMDRSITPAYF
jgi:hypothetical protein